MVIRSVKPLSAKLERNLASYATAAGAAGMSILTMAVPTQAKVIYTPAHVRLRTGGQRVCLVDLNKDGLGDLVINIASNFTNYTSVHLFASGPNYSNGIQRGNYAFARKLGGRIGPGKYFGLGKTQIPMLRKLSNPTSTLLFGPWVNVQGRFLGIKFLAGNSIHYGWARLNVHFEGSELHATLTGYAYETIPAKSIVAGDEGTGAKSLGHLALGAAKRK